MAQKQISCDLVYDRVPPLSSSYPWFVGQNLEQAKDDQDQILYSKQDPLSRYRCRIPELIGRRIRDCFHGWVILSDRPDMVMWSVWNPITSELIRLPPLTHEPDDSYHCCLSSPPDDPGSIFMLTSTKKPTIFFCRLDRNRENLRWTELSYAEQLNELKDVYMKENFPEAEGCLKEDAFLRNLTCCNGKVYALILGDYYRFVIQVDIVGKDNEDVVTLLPVVKVPDSCFLRCPSFNSCRTVDVYMKGSPTELFYIETGFEDENRKTVGDVFLSKLDLTNMMWEVMKDLTGDIFVSNEFLIYSPGIGSELGGYIHILGEMRQEIYSYSVKSKTVFLSSMPCLAETSQQSVWSMLECRLADHSDSEQKQGDDTDEKKVARSVTCDVDALFYSTTDVSHLLRMPLDVLKSIVELCVGVDYLNFRAASKYCRSAAPCDETFVRRLRTYSLPSPWLLVFDKHQGIITFTDPMSGDKYFLKTPEELIDYQICYCRFGWLLMHRIDGPMVFYNPFTNEVRELPRPELRLDSYCFSAPPTSLDCYVLGFLKSGRYDVYIHPAGWYWTEEEYWSELGRENLHANPQYFRFPTFHDGDYYALSDAGGIHVLKNLVSQDDPSWEVLIAEAPESCSTSTPVKRFLAECDQHLIQVVVGVFGESIEVFSYVDDTRREWVKMDGLGNHSVYICGTTCLCVEARTPEMGNKIYFPILHSKKIMFYSLETCRFHTFDGKNVEGSFEDFFETKYHTNPHAWIEPSWS